MNGRFPIRSRDTIVIPGRESILAWSGVLEQLAEVCGQEGAFHWLEVFLDAKGAERRLPRLVLEFFPGGDARRAAPRTTSPGQLRSAVLLWEYRVLGVGSGLFLGDDDSGWRTVVARPQDRAQAAWNALQAVAGCGARVAVAPFTVAEGSSALDTEMRPAASQRPVHWGVRARTERSRLPLGRDLEDTIAPMARSARVNFRYYRRKLEREHNVEFVADARGELSFEQLSHLHAQSAFPVSEEALQRRYQACQRPGSYVCGLRLLDGTWLSICGGWRQGGVTVLYFQINHADWEKASLCQVMRSFLIEHEITAGAGELLLFGGTPHPMHSAFRTLPVQDLVVRTPGWGSYLLVRLAPLLLGRMRGFGRAGYLGELLSPGALVWRRSEPRSEPACTPTPFRLREAFSSWRGRMMW